MLHHFRILLILLVALPCCATDTANAQGEPAKVTVDDKTVKIAKELLSGTRPASDAEGVAAVKKCCEAFIAEFSQPYDKADAIPNFRATHMKLRDLSFSTKTAEARGVLVGNIVMVATKYARDPKASPAARVNCVTLLAELDEALDQRTRTRKPSTKALIELLNLLNPKSSTPTYLQAVTLQALERHVRDGFKGWSDGGKKRVRDIAAQYANKPPIEDQDREVHTWLTRRGLDILREAKANDAVDSALGYLADPNQMPSLRLTSLQYLSAQTLPEMNDQQKDLYTLGLAHFLRSQLFAWHQAETNRQNTTSGASTGGGYSGARGGMGGSLGMSSRDDGGGMAMDTDAPARRSTRGRPNDRNRRSGSTTKPLESQDWQARAARRRLNDLTQAVRLAVEGKRIEDETVSKTQSFLSAQDLGLGEKYNFARLIELLDNLQTQINDAELITNVQSVMNVAKRDIEDISRYAKGLPGFLEKYPELRSGEEDQLEELNEVETETPSDDAEPPADDQPAPENAQAIDTASR